MIAFADQDLVGAKRQRLALGPVAPASDGAAGAARSEREVLEAQDLGDGRAAVRRAHRSDPERTDGGLVSGGMGDLLVIVVVGVVRSGGGVLAGSHRLVAGEHGPQRVDG